MSTALFPSVFAHSTGMSKNRWENRNSLEA